MVALTAVRHMQPILIKLKASDVGPVIPILIKLKASDVGSVNPTGPDLLQISAAN